MLPVPIPPSWNIRWAEARWLRNSNSSPANSGYMGHQNNKSNSGIYRSSWVQETRPGAAWKRRKTYGLNRKKLRWAGMEGNVQETDLSGFRSFFSPCIASPQSSWYRVGLECELSTTRYSGICKRYFPLCRCLYWESNAAGPYFSNNHIWKLLFFILTSIWSINIIGGNLPHHSIDSLQNCSTGFDLLFVS